MATVLVLLLVTVVTCFICFYLYRKLFAHHFFVKEGIPGPKPHWLLGNVGALTDEKTRHLVIPNWTKQYGKIFGYFEGSRPTLVTSDVDVVMQVFVKQFPTFHARKRLPIQPDPNSNSDAVSMFLAVGDRWKRLRTIVNPTFSAGKMRAIMPLMTKCQNDFMQLLDEKAAAAGEAFNIFECFKLLTLDTISETAFGIELNSSKNNKKNPVLMTLTEMFRTIFEVPLALKIAIVVPETAPALRILEHFRGKFLGAGFMKSRYRMLGMIAEIINSRKANKALQKRQDLLQMMIEMEESPNDNETMKGLSLDEITGQAMVFMIAGYETSSNALAFITFSLANHPNVQDKLIAEIDEHFGPNSDYKAVDYDSVYDLPYLEAVINETLRLYPIAPMIVNRMAVEDTVINGIHIPKGLPIMADVWSIHRDEDQWGPVDPEMFHPERFLDDYPTKQTRSDAAFIPFGYGPRICIGMRFALLEIKLTLVNLLRKYRIAKTNRTGDKVKLIAAFTITPVDGVWIGLIKR